MVADSHYVNCSFLAVKYYEMARWRPIFLLRNNIGSLIFYHKITLVTQLPMDTHSTRVSYADGEDPDTAMATPNELQSSSL